MFTISVLNSEKLQKMKMVKKDELLYDFIGLIRKDRRKIRMF